MTPTVTIIAELNYLFQNDEAQSRKIINELSNRDSADFLHRAETLIITPRTAKYHEHIRNEGEKNRPLISLGSSERVLTSCIIKQFIYFLDIAPSCNSHGYKHNKGFVNGYIFEPWLYMWIKFLSNIGSSIQDVNNQDYYIVKTDIKSFYSNVPHDNIKRMLLGGINERIDKKILTLTSPSKEKYKKFVHTLLEITATITMSNRGLPQGPAYARYLAELYLDVIDQKLDKKLKSGKLFLYQRYVDDIFFITSSEEDAKVALHELESDLNILGLEINTDKTSISRIKYFNEDFDNYRSQSKYAVDRVSKNFIDATATQKDLALKEFIKLIQSDTWENDLSFIFSHLSNVKQVDKLKREKVVPTLTKGIGRGSMLKHLFNFLIDDQENWNLLDEVGKLTDLQSEVFTSSVINTLENTKAGEDALSDLITQIENKLSRTKLVEEHLAYLYLKFSVNISIVKIPPDIIINSLASAGSSKELNISSELLRHINTDLNNIKKLSDFVEAMFPLCVSSKTSKDSLNELALTYYAKLGADQVSGALSIDQAPEIKTAFVAKKFYYLICLFSISNANKSIELLNDMWKYCANIFNRLDVNTSSGSNHNWLDKINDIDISNQKALLVISAIVDGNIFRGLDDKKRVFKKFHNIILVFITLQKKLLADSEIYEALEKLKEKATFYKWLIENDSVCQFPNKNWFETNIIKNSAIFLKKESLILIRKPSNDFYNCTNKSSEHNGYSEVLEEYNAQTLKSITEVLGGLSLKKRLDLLLNEIKDSYDEDGLPNIFCNEKILYPNSLTPFSKELCDSKELIFEDQSGNINTCENNLNNFIYCFFKVIPKGSNGLEFKDINEKYIQKVNKEINLLGFVRQVSNQLNEIGESGGNFYYDVAIAAALYVSLNDQDVIRKIDNFTKQYHKFNPLEKDRHIYCVNSKMILKDSTPIELLETIKKNLGIVVEEVLPSLSLYLGTDIDTYQDSLKKTAQLEDSDVPSLDLNEFKKGYHRISQINETININGTEFIFQKVNIINTVLMVLQQLEPTNTFIIESSEHVYYFINNGIAYITAIPNPISKIYRSMEGRLGTLRDSNEIKSYPDQLVSPTELDSLNNFAMAVENISIHRDIDSSKAASILSQWLRALPKESHQPLVTLVAAHVVMTQVDIQQFLKKVKYCLKKKDTNPFLIKSLGDYNGTHRVLYSNSDDLGRKIGKLDPLSISNEYDQATIIVDNIITGTQIINALKYYVKREGHDANYFDYDADKQKLVTNKLLALKIINICTIFYTTKSIAKIESVCRIMINDNVRINVIEGRAIDDNAFFGSTQKIGAQDKEQIIKLLADKDAMSNICSRLYTTTQAETVKEFTKDEIDKTNLITRYQSLPKKCFTFLQLGLKHNNKCYPFIRIPENYEK